MKLQTLKLTAFGPFTGVELDLSSGQNGLHMIYGANEAGKSSALRAIEYLLYGIPNRTSDNFTHPYQRLRIGGEFKHSTGKALDCVRRKGNQNTLRAGDDTAIQNDRELVDMLGDVDRELFRTMFGLNHERLRHGGEEIAKGDGRIGKLLFIAGAGLAGLQAVQRQLDEDTNQLFKSTGRSGKLLDTITEYRKTREELENAQVSVETWKGHDESLQKAQHEKERIDEAIRDRRGEQNRLIRIRDSIPTFVRWRKAVEELDSLHDAPILAADFAEKSSNTILELRKTEQRRADATTALKRVKDQLDELSVPDDLLAESDAIESLRDRLGGYHKATSDRPKLETSQATAEGSVREILRQLGRAPDLAQIEKLRLPADKTLRIQNLGNQQEGLVERLQSARRDCERLRLAISAADKRISETEILEGSEDLRRKIREIQQQGDLESQLVGLDDDIHRIEQEASAKSKQLTLWSGSLEEAESLSVPSLDTIERFEDDLRTARANLQTLRNERDKELRAKARITSELAQLELQHAVPTEDELRDCRRTRETGWQLLLEVLRTGSENNKNIDEFVEQLALARTLPDAYHRSVEDCDHIADQLRRDADRVATKGKLATDLEHHTGTCESLLTEIVAAETALSQLEEEWTTQWSSLGVTPLPPSEMRGWHRQQQEIAELASSLRVKRLEASNLSARITTLRAQLARVLEHSGVTVDIDTSSLRDLVAQASDRSDERQQAENQLDQLRGSLATNRDDLQDAKIRFEEAEVALKGWQADWAAEMNKLGLEENAIPAQANSVLTSINSLFQTFQEADQYRTRIEGIDRETREFHADVREFVQRVADELVSRPADKAVTALNERLREAQSKRVARDTLLQERANQDGKLDEANGIISELNAELDEMCRQAKCDEYEQLARAAAQSKRRIELDQLVRDFESQLLDQSGGAELAAFVVEVETEAVDTDSLQPRIDELEDDIKSIGESRDQILRQIEREEGELRKIDGSAIAAEKAANCGSIASRLDEQFHELAVLRAASAILTAGIEQHREKHQGPVLARASELFSCITEGAFQGLRADYDERGDPVLMGVRGGGGETVHIEGMSDGTCDQLYLALRLASLESWFERHEPIPFIVDDVLLNFDDERAIATLRVLTTFSSRTQVIFFTHHRHLVEMAKESLSEEELFVHDLGPETVAE